MRHELNPLLLEKIQQFLFKEFPNLHLPFEAIQYLTLVQDNPYRTSEMDSISIPSELHIETKRCASRLYCLDLLQRANEADLRGDLDEIQTLFKLFIQAQEENGIDAVLHLTAFDQLRAVIAELSKEQLEALRLVTIISSVPFALETKLHVHSYRKKIIDTISSNLENLLKKESSTPLTHQLLAALSDASKISDIESTLSATRTSTDKDKQWLLLIHILHLTHRLTIINNSIEKIKLVISNREAAEDTKKTAKIEFQALSTDKKTLQAETQALLASFNTTESSIPLCLIQVLAGLNQSAYVDALQTALELESKLADSDELEHTERDTARERIRFLKFALAYNNPAAHEDSIEFLKHFVGDVIVAPIAFPFLEGLSLKTLEYVCASFATGHVRHMMYTEDGWKMYQGVRQKLLTGSWNKTHLASFFSYWMVNIFGFRGHINPHGSLYCNQHTFAALMLVKKLLTQLSTSPIRSVLIDYLDERARWLKLKSENPAKDRYLAHIGSLARCYTDAAGISLNKAFTRLPPKMQADLLASYEIEPPIATAATGASLRFFATRGQSSTSIPTPTYFPALLANLHELICKLTGSYNLEMSVYYSLQIFAQAWQNFLTARAVGSLAPEIPLSFNDAASVKNLMQLESLIKEGSFELLTEQKAEVLPNGALQWELLAKAPTLLSAPRT